MAFTTPDTNGGWNLNLFVKEHAVLSTEAIKIQ